MSASVRHRLATTWLSIWLAACGFEAASPKPTRAEAEESYSPNWEPLLAQEPTLWSPPTLATLDRRPERLVSPTWSLDAAPASDTPYAPQPPDAAELFEHATATTATEALLVCKLEAKDVGFDYFSSPDPWAYLHLGSKGPRVSAKISLHASFITAPAVTLEVGETIAIHAKELDVFRDKPIGAVSLTYQGALPIEAGGEHFHVHCRGLTRGQMEPRLQAALQGFDATLREQTRTHPPRLTSVRFGRFDAKLLRAQISDAAAFVGWSDPRIVGRLEQLEQVEAAFDKGLGGQLARIAPSAQALNQWGSAELRAPRFACDEGPRGACFVTVTIVNLSDQSRVLDLDYYSGGLLASPRVVDYHGRRARLGAMATDEQRLRFESSTIEGRGQIEVRMELSAIDGGPLPSPPMVLLGKSPAKRSESGIAFEVWGGALSFALVSVSRDSYGCHAVVRITNHGGSHILGKDDRSSVGFLWLTLGTSKTLLKPGRGKIEDNTQVDREFLCSELLQGDLSEARLEVELERDDVYLEIP